MKRTHGIKVKPSTHSLIDAEFSERIAPHMIFNYAVYGLPSGVMKPLGEILNYRSLEPVLLCDSAGI